MKGRNRGGMGSHAGQGRGRVGDESNPGPSGSCICVGCGHEEPHDRGIPCVERKCPRCGKQMIRE
jgi:hypothetical protein